jgi:SAM-dependent MidA family methyltransferase
MEEYKFSIDAEGNVSSQKELSEQERDSKMPEIRRMIADETTSPGKIKRAIAEEIAAISALMIKYGNDVSIIEGMKVKVYAEQVKALRELGKEVGEADLLSHKDFLNIDGKKFKFVMGEVVECMKQAMKAVKLDETTINSVLNHWRDIMSAKDEDIRREVEKLDSKK